MRVRVGRNRSVLVLGSDRNKAFVQTLLRLELVPTFVRSLEGVVHAMRHMRARALLVDRDQRGADDLELVLNVRDLEPEIPIILIGSTGQGPADEILSSLAKTFLIHKPTNSGSLAADLGPVAEEAGLFSA